MLRYSEFQSLLDSSSVLRYIVEQRKRDIKYIFDCYHLKLRSIGIDPKGFTIKKKNE